MNYFLTVIIIVALLVYHNHFVVTSFQESKITVDIYYESLCPYSALFITKQFVPVFKYLRDYITVTFIPFGKSSATGYPIRFMCQHGPLECRGNQAQVCALEEIMHNFKNDVQQSKTVDIVGCVMGNRNPSSSILKCVKKIGLSEKLINKIDTCRNSKIGKELLVTYGKKTVAFESPLLSVPSVVINGVKNRNAVSNFMEEICQLILNKKPKACEDS